MAVRVCDHAPERRDAGHQPVRGYGSGKGSENVRKIALDRLACGQQFQTSWIKARKDGEFDAVGQVRLGLWVRGRGARGRRSERQIEREDQDQAADNGFQHFEPPGNSLRHPPPDHFRPEMKVRQRRSIQHRPPGMFQPPFQNVRLRIHAGSMGVAGIRRIHGVARNSIKGIFGLVQVRSCILQIVAHHLQIEAQKRSTADRDIFARSAFNRYYYCSFLLTRQLFQSISPNATPHAHKAFPEFLKTTIVKELNRGLEIARRTKDGELKNILNRAKSAALNLAQQLVLAYAVRVTADYNPESEVEFESKSRFALNGVSVTEAHQWEQKTKSYCRTIEDAWRYLDAQ